MRDSIVFYKSFYEAVKKIKDPNVKLEVLEAIMLYAFYDEPFEFTSDTAEAMWILIKPQIDANNVRYENGKKGAEYGKLGGRPNKNPIGVNNKNPIGVNNKNPSGVSKKTPNVNENENDNVNVNVNEADLTDEDLFLYGIQNNVELTKAQREKLTHMYRDSNKLIDKVSNWLPTAIKPQTDHYSLCLRFAQNDDWPKRPREKEPEPVAEHEPDYISEEERLRNIAEMKARVKGALGG